VFPFAATALGILQVHIFVLATVFRCRLRRTKLPICVCQVQNFLFMFYVQCNSFSFVGFEVLTAVAVRSSVMRDITPYSLVEVSRHSSETSVDFYRTTRPEDYFMLIITM
jgi:hypothetical protein